jgi:DNA-binding SARP family transcriptional activator
MVEGVRATARDRDLGIEIRLLGPLEALRGGRPVSLGGATPRALLAVLALEPGRVVSVDRLLESLWPGEAPDTATHAIQVYVSRLRKALGTSSIATRAPGYVCDLDPECVDVHRFARLADEGRLALQAGREAQAGDVLRSALDLWRGPALSDFVYEPFAQAEIARLEDLRLLVLEERVEAELALGRHLALVPELEALVESHPLRERLRGQLMLALYRSGRQAEALDVYRAGRKRLDEELGIEPSPELRRLETAILRHDISLVPAGAAAATVPLRRLVTVLRVETATGTTMDPEAAAEILAHLVATVEEAVVSRGGRVEDASGASILATFGLPLVHEDDSLRAAGAALDIRARVGDAVRIGIEAGDLVASSVGGRRLLTGEAVAGAESLARNAGPGETLVGPIAGRLIDHAAVLEPRELAATRAYALAAISPAAPAFARRQDARFVGRIAELDALSRAFRCASVEAAARPILVVGPAGSGKSRLAAEFAARVEGATILRGRCLSYGEGITYGPLREAFRQAPPDLNGLAPLLAALDADTRLAPMQVAVAARRFCEELARERPLVLVLDDLHWAEPALLELIGHVSSRSGGRILVLCLGRDELLEDAPTFLADAGQLVLDALSDADMETLLDGLGGSVLTTDRRDRILDAAGGNPFFLEQLLALDLEGRAELTLPTTIRALLSARLDRLGPGERALLEHGSVIGREFATVDVVSLLPPDAVRAAETHFAALTHRGFLRGLPDAGYAFRHVLVREAVYHAAPKRLRADLHERFAARLDQRAGAAAELDELVGHHLEQAHALRTDLRELDEHTGSLGREAGSRLGAAGLRALRRGDVHAASGLLERGVALLPGESRRRELLCELALVRFASQQPDAAVAALDEAIAGAVDADDERVRWRARIELEYIRLRRDATATADDLLDAAAGGIPVFERAGDRRALGRAWLLAGFVHGGFRGDHAAWLESAERALEHYRAAGWPTSTCVGEIAAALYWGATPVDAAVRRCEELLEDETLDLAGPAYLRAFLGGLHAQRGSFAEARGILADATATLEELGLRAAADTYCTPLAAEIELLADDPAGSERILRGLCDRLEHAGDLSHLASRASDLAEALVELGSLDEAETWTQVAERHAAPGDRNAQLAWRVVRARIRALRGELGAAEQLAREGVALADETDDFGRRAKAYRELGRVLRLAGDDAGACSALDRAIELFERKGCIVGVARVRSLQRESAVA